MPILLNNKADLFCNYMLDKKLFMLNLCAIEAKQKFLIMLHSQYMSSDEHL